KLDVHRRLMLMASIAIIFPAVGRIPIVLLAKTHLSNMTVAITGGGLVLAFVFGLPAALFVYDLITRRRPHPATWISTLVFLLQFSAACVLGGTPMVQAAIRALE